MNAEAERYLRRATGGLWGRRRREVREHYDFPTYVFGLLQRLDPGLASVSVVIPAYNEERTVREAARQR